MLHGSNALGLGTEMTEQTQCRHCRHLSPGCTGGGDLVVRRVNTSARKASVKGPFEPKGSRGLCARHKGVLHVIFRLRRRPYVGCVGSLPRQKKGAEGGIKCASRRWSGGRQTVGAQRGASRS